jgi:hypothetical protein
LTNLAEENGMKTTTSLVAAAIAGVVLVASFQIGWKVLAAEKDEPQKEEVPTPPEDMATAPKSWEPLDFEQTIPVEWGTVISINRVEKGGESYTFWFLGTDGTLRGITTREFTGPNRATFFPEVYVIRRR